MSGTGHATSPQLPRGLRRSGGVHRPLASSNDSGWRAWFPDGTRLSDTAWGGRHRAISAVLWAHVPVLAAVGLANGYAATHVGLDLALVVSLAVMGRLAKGWALASGFVSCGLLTCSAVLVHLTGGLTESHFHFFVMLPLVALYQDVRPFLLSVGFVVVHHSLLTSLVPESVFADEAAHRKPFLWAGIHAAFVVAGVLVQAMGWRFGQLAQQADDAERAAEEAIRAEALEGRLAAEQAAREAAERIAVDAADRERANEAMRRQAEVLAASSSGVTAGVAELTGAVRALERSISAVAGSAEEATGVADEAVGVAADTTTTVARLGESSAEIEAVVRLITGIAEQTNLLALNATIEAARAGEAGKGFGVVAAEVKELASATAKATEDIDRMVGAIRDDTAGAVAAIERISGIIGRIDAIQRRIGAEVDQQVAATADIESSVGALTAASEAMAYAD